MTNKFDRRSFLKAASIVPVVPLALVEINGKDIKGPTFEDVEFEQDFSKSSVEEFISPVTESGNELPLHPDWKILIDGKDLSESPSMQISSIRRLLFKED